MELSMRSLMAAILLIVTGLVSVATPAAAQERPRPMVEAVVGSSGFVDEVWDYFFTVGAGGRVFVSPRVAIGPEIAYQRGADDASNLTLTGNLTFDLVTDRPGRRVVPYIAAGGGYLRQRTLVGSGPGSPVLQPFTSSEGTFSAGAGVRVAIGQRLYVAPEFRLGYEPETRFAVMIGLRPGG
jgi:hypothetical protein